MSMKERFTEEEWEVLLGMVLQLIVGTAMVVEEGGLGPFQQHVVGTKMAEAVARLARAATNDPDPLYQELATQLEVEIEIGRAIPKDMAQTNPDRCKQILGARLTVGEYQRFLLSVWADGIAVARSSGGKKRVFRPDIDPVSENEAKLLAEWAMFYGIDPAGMSPDGNRIMLSGYYELRFKS